MSSSSARALINVNPKVLGELSRLFAPEFFVKKEELDPFISLLNGIKYEYWDNAERFRLVIGLLHQLKLDVSTQVLEYQQLLIKNRLRHLLQDTPELLETLLEMISDASNNKRHVLNTRPMSVGLTTNKRRKAPAVKTKAAVVGTRPPSAFVVRNNTVTLPWQPWFAHIVPKSSATGRTVVRLQQGHPYPFLVPKIPAHAIHIPSQKVATTKGLVTVQPSFRITTTKQLSTNKQLKSEAEFGVSRQIYDGIPSSLQTPAPPVGTKVVDAMEEKTSNDTKQALLKKQQEFLKRLALLKTEQKKDGQGCQKQLFPPSTGPYEPDVSQSRGDHLETASYKHPQATSSIGVNQIRMGTRQSTNGGQRQPTKVKYAVAGSKRRSPRNKGDEEKEKYSQKNHAAKSKQNNDQEEKGLLLSHVSENCIVISVPNQSSTTSASPKKSDTSAKTSSLAMIDMEKRKKHKKKKRCHRSTSKDRKSCSVSELAFSRIQKLHKKQHRAWKKEARRASKAKSSAQGTPQHREVLEAGIESNKQMKISTNLFKIKRQLNKNNSCSSDGSTAETVEVVRTPRKHPIVDKQQLSPTDLPSLLSPSCFVSLKKMKLESGGDAEMSLKARVRYPVNNSSSFSYSREMSFPVNCVDQHWNQAELSAGEEMIDVVHLDTSSLDANNSLKSSATYAVQVNGDNSAPYTLNNEGITVSAPQPVTHPSMNLTHSFLGRLLTSPSTPHHVKEQREHPRVRRAKPRDELSRVRKSKRQKRKRRREERRAQHNKACVKS